jgi:hypothetical protein
VWRGPQALLPVAANGKTWIRYDYLHDGVLYPLLAEQRQVKYALNLPYGEVEPVRQRRVLHIDHIASASLWRTELGQAAKMPAWGLWRRIDDAVIDALCCWPETETFGPSPDEVCLSGGWINGEWRSALYRRHLNALRLHALRKRWQSEVVDDANYWLPPLDASPPAWNFAKSEIPNMYFEKQTGLQKSHVAAAMRSEDGHRTIHSQHLEDIPSSHIGERLIYIEPGLRLSFEFQPPDNFHLGSVKALLSQVSQRPDAAANRNFIRRIISPDSYGVLLHNQGPWLYYPDDAAKQVRACFPGVSSPIEHLASSKYDIGDWETNSNYRMWKHLDDCFLHALPFMPGLDEAADERRSPFGEQFTCCIVDVQGGIVGGAITKLSYPTRQIRLKLNVRNAREEIDWTLLFK